MGGAEEESVVVKRDAGVVGFYDSDDEHFNGAKKKKKKAKAGAFEGMGLGAPLLKAVRQRGYTVPTPVQRKTIPLVLEGRDVVGMARTGSGKTACFLLPILERLRLKGTGPRSVKALILCPTRELALQTSRFVRELGKWTDVKHCVVTGGEGMESQFSSLHSMQPDLVVATPGRLLHVLVEMNLRFDSLRTLVLDEADRLFEMGLEEELKELMSRLPESRQTLLFSATLPKALIHFARAGLHQPVLVRLDVEAKVPPGLEASFLLCRGEEKAAVLLTLLTNVVPSSASVIIFTATRHHVEFINTLLECGGITSAMLYSELDASARKINTARFEARRVRILVVTDVAARGIDIPCVDYVINYNFPAKPKLFVHRVGRCARAGRRGWAVSLVAPDETCYLLDLHLFLGRPIAVATPESTDQDMAHLGSAPRHLVDDTIDQIRTWEATSSELVGAKKTSENAYKQYLRCRAGASRESLRRAKEINQGPAPGVHMLFQKALGPSIAPKGLSAGKFVKEKKEAAQNQTQDAAAFVESIRSYRPPGNIFEIGQSSRSEQYQMMKRKREAHRAKILGHKGAKTNSQIPRAQLQLPSGEAEDSVVESTFSRIIGTKRRVGENFIPYQPLDLHTELGLEVGGLERDGSAAGLDLTGDTEADMRKRRANKANEQHPSKKKIKSESGAWISASFRSGRFEQWVEKTKVIERGDAEDLPQPQTVMGKKGKGKGKKDGLGLNSPSLIVKRRLEKEKRQRRNGPKKKKFKKRK